MVVCEEEPPTLTAKEEELMHTCLHEAGHAVVAAYLGVPFEYVTAVPIPKSQSLGHIVTIGKLPNYRTIENKLTHIDDYAALLLAARVVMRDLHLVTPPEWGAREFNDGLYECSDIDDDLRIGEFEGDEASLKR